MLANSLSGRCLFCRLRRDEQYPVGYLDYYNSAEGVTRTLGVGTDDDGKQVFIATGEVQEFEDTSRYLDGDVNRRLTESIVLKYLNSIGIQISTASFWTPPTGILLWDDEFGRRVRPGRD